MPLESLVAPLAAFLAPTSALAPPPVQFNGQAVVQKTVYFGGSSLNDDFAPADDPWVLGIALDVQEPSRETGFEVGLFYSYADGNTDVGASSLKIETTIYELWSGGRWDFDPWSSSVRPYIGVGGSVLYAKYRASGDGDSDSNSGWAFGLYGHGGCDWHFAEGWAVGVDVRALVSTKAPLQEEVPLDYTQAALTLSWSW